MCVLVSVCVFVHVCVRACVCVYMCHGQSPLPWVTKIISLLLELMCVHVHALSCELADVFFPGMGVISDRLSSTDLVQVQYSLALHVPFTSCVYLKV